jgi:hypothetical protein
MHVFNKDPKPTPASVGCLVYRQCASQCGTCMSCREFNEKLKSVGAHDAVSLLRRNMNAERERYSD